MNCIRYHEVEKMLKLYPVLKAILDSLQVDLELIRDQDIIDDAIYSLCLGNKSYEGTIAPGKINDITGRVAAEYWRSSKISATELKRDILELSAVVEKIDIGMNSLTKIQKKIIELFYWGESRTWAEVVKKMNDEEIFISVSQGKRLRQKSIKKLMAIAKIPIETYKRVLVMLEGGGDSP